MRFDELVMKPLIWMTERQRILWGISVVLDIYLETGEGEGMVLAVHLTFRDER